jgi:hypothetical protein
LRLMGDMVKDHDIDREKFYQFLKDHAGG